MKKIKLKKNLKEKSRKWLSRQFSDNYYKNAKKDHLRSRSAYKLIEIHEKFKIFFPGSKTLDLGAAPGGWSIVAQKYSQPNGKVIGVDKLKINPSKDINFLVGDLTDEVTIKIIEKLIPEKLDILISDMSPNTIGHRKTDHLRIIVLAEIAFEFAMKFLKKDGFFICKLFQGGGIENLIIDIKKNFHLKKFFKPLASRKESSEIYLVAKKK